MTTLRNLLFMLLFGWVGFLPGSSMSQATMGGKAEMSGKAEMGDGYNYPGTWSDFVRRATLAVGKGGFAGTGFAGTDWSGPQT